MNNKILSLIKYFVGWPISILSLYFVFKIINPELSVILPLVKHINIFTLLIAIFCLLVYFSLRSYLWKIILKANGYNLSLKEVVFDWGMSELKRYTPGNILSFLARTFSFSNKGVAKKTIIKSLGQEAILVILGSTIVSLLSISFIFNFFSIGNNEMLRLTVILLVLILSLFFIYGNKIIKFPKSNKLSSIYSFFYLGSNLERLEMLIVSTITMFFFGLGSYFVMYSFFQIEIAKIFIFSSFFTFSLLIGYLSLITPMGLGVREWVITIGFLQVLSASASGLVSILTRLIFIFSEILFLIFVWLWTITKFKFVLRLENFISKYRHESLLIFFMLIYNVYFSVASFLRHDNFYTGRFDLGNMDQVIWNTANGRIFQLTDPNGTEIVSRLAYHSDFILVFLSPLYFIWSNPKVILLFQTVILSLGAMFVFLIAKNILRNKNISLVLSFLYLISPAVNHTNLYDFHAVTLATTFLLSAFYFLIKREHLLFTFFVILSALTKEQLWLTAGMLFFYFALKEGLHGEKLKRITNFVIGILLSILSFVIFYDLLWILIPNARGGEHFALAYYSNFGQSPFNIAVNIIFDPIKTFSIIFHPDNVLYLGQLFLPLGLTSIFSPFYLLFAIPNLVINLLSSNVQLHQIYYQYSSAITPFVFVSAIFGIRTLQKRIKFLTPSMIITYLLLTGIYFAYLYGPLPGAKNPNLAMFDKPLLNREAISNYLSNIPTNYKVAASNNLGAHLSHREYIYTIPIGIEKADIVVFLLNDNYAQFSLKSQKEIAKNLENNKNYMLKVKDKDFVVFEKIK